MIEQTVTEMIEPVLKDLGYDLVRVHVSGAAGAQTLQIMAEPFEKREMLVEDCAEISHAVSALLDVEDPIVSKYTLEVSSPGIDRPLVRLADYERFRGFEAKIELKEPIEGRRRARGHLMGTQEGSVVIKVDTQDMTFPFASIARAKLLLTDELIAAVQDGLV